MWIVEKKHRPADDFWSLIYFGASEPCCQIRYEKSKALLKAGERLRLRHLQDVIESCEAPVNATALIPDESP